MQNLGPFRNKNSDQTQKEIQEALAHRVFIKAAPSTTASKTLRLSSAQNFWKKGLNYVYNLDYRLVGTPEEVERVLADAGVPESTIKESMRNRTITKNNYNTTMKEEYEEELEEAALVPKTVKEKKGPEYSLEELDEGIQNAGITPGAFAPGKKKKEKVLSPKKTKPPTSPSKPRGSLYQRLLALPEGKVIDVSEMTAAGTGAKQIPIPKVTSKNRTPKVGFIDVVSIVSNNYPAYRRAMDLLAEQNPEKASQYEGLTRRYLDTYGETPKVSSPGPVTPPTAVGTKTEIRGPPAAKTITKKVSPTPPPPTTTKLVPKTAGRGGRGNRLNDLIGRK